MRHRSAASRGSIQLPLPFPSPCNRSLYCPGSGLSACRDLLSLTRAAAFLRTPNAESSLTHHRRESRGCRVFGDVAVALWHLLVPKYFESVRVVVLHVPEPG